MSALGRIAIIAGTTVREAVRNRLLYAMLLFAVAAILSGLLLSSLSYVERDRILQDLGFAAIRVFGVAIAVFLGVGLIHEGGSSFLLFKKGTRRTELGAADKR